MTQNWTSKQCRCWVLLLSLYRVHLCWLWSYVLLWPIFAIGCDGVKIAQYPSSRYLYVPLPPCAASDRGTEFKFGVLPSDAWEKKSIEWHNLHMSHHASALHLTFDKCAKLRYNRLCLSISVPK